jgi:hypothetical protein
MTELALFDAILTTCNACGRGLDTSTCRWCNHPDEGKAAALAAKSEWHAHAVAWVKALRGGTTLTSEDLIQAIGLPSGEIGQHKNNAVGAAMGAISKTGLIEHLGYVKSKRKASHGAVLSLWRRV